MLRASFVVGVFLAMAGPAFAQQFFKLDLSGVEGLPPGVSWVPQGPDGGFCLRVDVPADKAAEAHLVTIPIDVKALRDREILLSYDVRADDVSRPDKDYNGIKAQLHFESPSRGPRWFNEGLLYGNFGWKRSELLFRVDSDAEEGVLQLGMQECSGTALLANVTITVVGAKPERPQRVRGMVGATAYSEEDLAQLARWNVNVIRWQLVNPAWDRTSVPSDPTLYREWLDPKLDELASVLDHARKLGIKVIVDLHYPPGGRLPDGTLRMVLEKPLQEMFIGVWQDIARRFRGHTALWGYDIMNEPLQNHPSPPGVDDWFDLQAAAAQAVRAIDPSTPILIAADQWDSPEAFEWMRPVEVSNVIYTVHMYWPYEYTHQGAEGPSTANDKSIYPGTFNTLPFDKAALAAHLSPVREFQQAYGARILVGEFSVARWAPGAARYLSDVVSLFEEYGWDWTYHAFREQSAWNLEHANLPYDPKGGTNATTPTDRYRVLEPLFQKNRRIITRPRVTPELQ